MGDAIQIITRGHADYPPLLLEITDPPEQLYVRGNIKVLADPKLIAVVGSRRANTYGRQCLLKLLPPIVRAGVPIVSGLAFGIDSLAHKACLDNSRPTVAVLGGGIDDATIAPRSNFRLAMDILAGGGALVSEYAPGSPPHKGTFPERNRIIAGLCRTILIAQAGEYSGSLITARLGLEYNRDVCAIPGPITDPLSLGTNQLIQQGAAAILGAEDLLSLLGLTAQERQIEVAKHLSEQQIAILQKISHDPVHIDDVTAAANLPADQVAALLIELELLSVVRSVGGMRYVRS